MLSVISVCTAITLNDHSNPYIESTDNKCYVIFTK